MTRILFAVLLLVVRAASADPVPATKKAGAHGAGSAPASTSAAAAEPGQAPETTWASPELPPLGETEIPVGMPAHAAPPASAKAEAAARPGSPASSAKPLTAAPAEKPPRTLLASMRALKVAEGEARVTVEESERVLRPGDLLGVDTVRTVSDGVIVLDRPAVPGRPGGAAVVVVRFDVGGEARVRILYEQDPTPARAPRVH